MGSITVQLFSSLTRLYLTKSENRLLFVYTDAVEYKLVKLGTSYIPVSDTSPNGECSLTQPSVTADGQRSLIGPLAELQN